MENNQTIYKKSNWGKLQEHIKSLGVQSEKYRRFKVGCDVTDCEKFDVIMLSGIVCKDLCYYNYEMDNNINDFLVTRV